MGAYLIDNPPRIRQFRRPRRSKPSGVVVVHTAESFPDERPPDMGAENVANFIRTRTNYGSYHDLCDSDSIVWLVPYDAEAYGDGTGSNTHAYHVSAATQAAKWSSLSGEWKDATVRNMARATARYARWLKKHHHVDIPARRITRAQSENRVPGFISHAQRDPSRRSDPGAGFPWRKFLRYYEQEMQPTEAEEFEDMDKDKFQEWVRSTKVPVKVGSENEQKEWTLGVLLQHMEQEQDSIKRKLNEIIELLKRP